MAIYRSFDGLGHLDSSTSFYTKFSFGMIGFPGNTCGKSIIYFDPDVPYESQSTQLKFQCQQTTQIEAILSVGVIKTDHRYDDYDISTLNQCYLKDGIEDFETYPEMEYFNTTSFKQSLME